MPLSHSSFVTPTGFYQSTRFAKLVDASVLQEAAKGVILLKTEQSTLWAVKNFDCWVHAQSCSSSNVVPPDLLRSHAELVRCFVLEMRRPMDHATHHRLRSLVSGLNFT